MSCLQSLKGLAFNECETNLAGVKAIWLSDAVDSIVAISASTSALTVEDVSGATFYKYGMDEGQGYLTSTSSVGDTGRIRYFTNEIRIAFEKLSAERHAEFMALTHNPVKAIVLDQNDVYHYVSYDKYLRANDGAYAQTGQGDDDINGYEVILSGKSAYPSFIIKNTPTCISEPDQIGA